MMLPLEIYYPRFVSSIPPEASEIGGTVRPSGARGARGPRYSYHSLLHNLVVCRSMLACHSMSVHVMSCDVMVSRVASHTLTIFGGRQRLSSCLLYTKACPIASLFPPQFLFLKIFDREERGDVLWNSIGRLWKDVGFFQIFAEDRRPASNEDVQQLERELHGNPSGRPWSRRWPWTWQISPW